jgi:hypothetical protein
MACLAGLRALDMMVRAMDVTDGEFQPVHADGQRYDTHERNPQVTRTSG